MHSNSLREFFRHGSRITAGRASPGSLHPLTVALWKSPVREYRRRRGNGGLL